MQAVPPAAAAPRQDALPTPVVLPAVAAGAPQKAQAAASVPVAGPEAPAAPAPTPASVPAPLPSAKISLKQGPDGAMIASRPLAATAAAGATAASVAVPSATSALVPPAVAAVAALRTAVEPVDGRDTSTGSRAAQGPAPGATHAPLAVAAAVAAAATAVPVAVREPADVQVSGSAGVSAVAVGGPVPSAARSSRPAFKASDRCGLRHRWGLVCVSAPTLPFRNACRCCCTLHAHPAARSVSIRLCAFAWLHAAPSQKIANAWWANTRSHSLQLPTACNVRCACTSCMYVCVCLHVRVMRHPLSRCQQHHLAVLVACQHVHQLHDASLAG